MAYSHTQRQVRARIPLPGDFPQTDLWLQLYCAEVHTAHKRGQIPVPKDRSLVPKWLLQLFLGQVPVPGKGPPYLSLCV